MPQRRYKFPKGHKINLGRELSQEQIEKQRNTLKKRYASGEIIVHNKGTKGLMKPNKTSFKKGNIPYNKGKKRPELSGKNHWNFKGNYDTNHKIRMSPQYLLWRKEVYKRDNYTCQNPNCKYCNNMPGKPKLIAHHIVPFAECMDLDYKELTMDIDNGITYCVSYHNNYHSSGG